MQGRVDRIWGWLYEDFPYKLKTKQWKLATYIYAIHDEANDINEGFDEVAEVTHNFYRGLLGKQYFKEQGWIIL